MLILPSSWLLDDVDFLSLSCVFRSGSSGSPPKTRLATKQTDVTEHSVSKQRDRRRENREHRKQQTSKGTTKKVETVGCKESKVRHREESQQVKGVNDVEVEDMEMQENDVETMEQQEEQMLRTLSEDLALSDTDEDLDPMATNSQYSHTHQGLGMSSCQQQDDVQHGVDHQQDISIPDSHSVSQHLELSRSDAVNSHASCEQNQLREKTLTRRVHCARCIKYNCTATNERRRQHLVALWLLPEEEKTERNLEIVTRSEGDDRRKCTAWLTKSCCDKMIKNGYRMKVIKKEPGTEQELLLIKLGIKTEPKDSYIPYHLLLTGQEHPEERSSSPEVRNMAANSGGDIIKEAMQAALNGDSLSVEQETASGINGQPVIDESNCDRTLEVMKDVHKMDVTVDNAATPLTSLGDMPTSAHQN